MFSFQNKKKKSGNFFILFFSLKKVKKHFIIYGSATTFQYDIIKSLGLKQAQLHRYLNTVVVLLLVLFSTNNSLHVHWHLGYQWS